MNFFIQMNPPTATAQEKKVRVVHGKPLFFDPAPVKQAKQELTGYLMPHKPNVPLEGPLSLSVIWLFPKGKSHKHGEWRVTRPDTDNLEKMLKDCMTRTGFWKDDAQVVHEVVEKRWSDEPSGIYIEIEKLEDSHEPL
jgi:Holliday junction resolvase RusA-like endonuclease